MLVPLVAVCVLSTGVRLDDLHNPPLRHTQLCRAPLPPPPPPPGSCSRPRPAAPACSLSDGSGTKPSPEQQKI